MVNNLSKQKDKKSLIAFSYLFNQSTYHDFCFFWNKSLKIINFARL
ncbi:hypothetical protein FH5_03798 [Priestia endophytica]|jgi:hypothetical protein|nr:hypothetical protein FH5_03798 [Priestia endophytica]